MKKKMLKRKPLKMLFMPVFLLVLNSCIGISADIQMNRDGSGRITLEYRFPRMAETIGRLDGNEKWQIIPAGRADFERTLARIPDMRLVSFSSREQDKDIVNNVTLEFKNTEALLAFLDPAGKRASLSRTGNSSRLNIILNESVSPEINTDLLNLMKQVSAGYKVSISFSADGNSTMALTDGAGNAITPPAEAQLIPSGKKVSLEIGTPQILTHSDGLGAIFTWN
jgi:hypothetical protein